MSINVVNRKLAIDYAILARYLAVILTLALLLSWGGAFRSWVLSMPLRIGFWLIIATLLLSQMTFIWSMICRSREVNQFTRFVMSVVAAILTTVLVSAEVNLLKMLPISPLAPAPFVWQTAYFLVPVMSIGIASVYLLGAPSRKQVECREPVTGLEFPSVSNVEDRQRCLLQPEDSNARIEWPEFVPEWIHSQDHYLELYSQGQRILLRARMKDAEDHYSEIPAARVHRSWWVSACAVKKILREGRNYRLITNRGEKYR